jgi:hypothetical protein
MNVDALVVSLEEQIRALNQRRLGLATDLRKCFERELSARRAVPAERLSLENATARRSALEAELRVAKTERAERERRAAERANSCCG